jgi:hypothetical protein
VPFIWNDGIMEQWNLGDKRPKKIISNLSQILLTQYSTVPPFHYSNWGGAPKFSIIPSFCPKDAYPLGTYNRTYGIMVGLDHMGRG